MTNLPSRPGAQDPFPVSGPVDILAFIPHSLGFVPQESLVLMTMDSSRLGATLRLDLPAAAVDYSDFAVRVTELLRSDRAANGVLMALYTDRKWKKPGVPPYRKLVNQLGRHLADAGLPLRDGWLVSDSAWREYFCTDSGCCPWPGRPLSQIGDSTLSAEMVFRGSAYASSLEEAVGQDLPPVWEGGQQLLHRARYSRRIQGNWCGSSQFAGTLAVWNAFMNSAAPEDEEPRSRGAGGPENPEAQRRGCPQLRSDPEAAGFLLASLHARPVRDTLLVAAALGSARALGGAEACGLLSVDEGPPLLPAPGGTQLPVPPLPGRDGPAAGSPGCRAAGSAGPATGSGPGRDSRRKDPDEEQVFREVLIGQYAGKPDWSRMDAAFAVFSELLAASGLGGGSDVEADQEAAAALLTLLAWIEWARGRGSRAQVYLGRCLETCPGYRLAELLEELLATGMFPVWARKAGTAWRAAAERHPGGART